MGTVFYGAVKLLEATILYLVVSVIAGSLDSPIPPIGSPVFLAFVLAWPLVSPLLNPGLRKIPILGEALGTLDQLARSYYPGSRLLSAASRGRTATAEKLLGKGISVDTRDSSDGRTPLLIAAEGGHLEMVRLLIANGAAVDAVDTAGKTALMAACIGANVDVVRELTVRDLGVDRSDKAGFTALMYAAAQGQAEIVQLLLDCNADRAIANAAGQTAMDIAAKNKRETVVEILKPNTREEGSVEPTTTD